MDLMLKTEHGEAITVTSNIETYDLEKRLAAMQVILDIVNAAQRGSIYPNGMRRDIMPEDFEFFWQRIREEAEMTLQQKGAVCNQCDGDIKQGDTCYRIGHNYYCSQDCLMGD